MTMRLQLILLLLLGHASFAQEKWDLRKSVEHALQNNISVKQADLQVRFAELELQQNKLSQLPNLNLSSSVGYSSGRNQDPTTYSLITTGYAFNNISLQANADFFNWFSKRNTIAAKDLSLKATQAGFEKAKNDVALNVAVAYLQVLLSREQITLAKANAAQTFSQLDRTRKLVTAGRLPELDAVNLESVLAGDSASLITAQAATIQALLQMKALLNIDAAVEFDVAIPPVDLIPVESLAELQPDAVYRLAIANLPQQKADALNVMAAKKSVEAAKGAMYPTFSLFGSLGSAYNSKAQEIISKTVIIAPVGTVTVGTTPYQVFPLTPFDSYTFGNMAYTDQLNQNFRQSVGLNVSIPILNGGNLRSAWHRSKLNVKQFELQQEQNSFTLKQDIYKAYNDAVAAMQKFNANKKAVAASENAYQFALKRYELGLLTTYDLITTQSTLLQAKSQLLYSQYDYLFKIKLLEFYKGQGLTL